MIQSIAHHLHREAVPANWISLSRPLIGFSGIVAFREYPVYLSMTLAVAFLLDIVDGTVARWYNRNRPIDQQSQLGGYIDLASDRILQLGALWMFYAYGMLPLALPLAFSVKDALFDPVRVHMDLKKGALNDALGQYSRKHKTQTLVHGILEAVFICGVPVLGGSWTFVLGVLTVAFGYYRGVSSIRYARKRVREVTP